jgi:hypothetical protein
MTLSRHVAAINAVTFRLTFSPCTSFYIVIAMQYTRNCISHSMQFLCVTKRIFTDLRKAAVRFVVSCCPVIMEQLRSRAPIGRICVVFYTGGLLKSLENIQFLSQIEQKQDSQCTVNLILRRVRATIVALE